LICTGLSKKPLKVDGTVVKCKNDVTGELTLKDWSTRSQANGKTDKLDLGALNDDQYLACIAEFTSISNDWFEKHSAPGGKKGAAMELAVKKAEAVEAKANMLKSLGESSDLSMSEYDILGATNARSVEQATTICNRDFVFEIDDYKDFKKQFTSNGADPYSHFKDLKPDSNGRYFMPLQYFYQKVKIRVLTRLLGNTIYQLVGKHLSKLMNLAKKIPGFSKEFPKILKKALNMPKLEMAAPAGLLGLAIKAVSLIPTYKLWQEATIEYKKRKTTQMQKAALNAETAFRFYKHAKFYPKTDAEVDKSWDKWILRDVHVKAKPGSRFTGATWKLGMQVGNFKKASQDITVKLLKFEQNTKDICSGTLTDQTMILLFKKQANSCSKALVKDVFASLKRYMSNFEQLKKKLIKYIDVIKKPLGAFEKVPKIAKEKANKVKKAVEKKGKAATEKANKVKKAVEKKGKAAKEKSGKAKERAGKSAKKAAKSAGKGVKTLFGGSRRRRRL